MYFYHRNWQMLQTEAFLHVLHPLPQEIRLTSTPLGFVSAKQHAWGHTAGMGGSWTFTHRCLTSKPELLTISLYCESTKPGFQRLSPPVTGGGGIEAASLGLKPRTVAEIPVSRGSTPGCISQTILCSNAQASFLFLSFPITLATQDLCCCSHGPNAFPQVNAELAPSRPPWPCSSLTNPSKIAPPRSLFTSCSLCS